MKKLPNQPFERSQLPRDRAPRSPGAAGREHRALRLICFNGAKAANLYRRSVLPKLPQPLKSIRCETLPSTSPANASIGYAEKLAQWSIVKEACEGAVAMLYKPGDSNRDE
jgi:hypothetical protein